MQQIGGSRPSCSAIRERREPSDALDTMRGTLQQTVAARDAALARVGPPAALLRPPSDADLGAAAHCRWRSA